MTAFNQELRQGKLFPLRVGSYDTTIGPDEAQEFLKLNTGNRPIRQRLVTMYANQMESGAWRFTGEPIVVGEQGVLISGQHRMLAVIRSGTTIKGHVRVLPTKEAEEAIAVVDTGAKRQAADLLAYNGVSSYQSCVAATARLIWQYKTGKANASWSTNAELLQIINESPGLEESARVVCNSSVKYFMPRSSGTFLHYLFGRIDPVLRDAFIGQLDSGAGLTEQNPVLILRRTLEREKNTRGHSFKDRRWFAALGIKAWNAVILGESVQVLRWNDKEAFPLARNKQGKFERFSSKS